MEEVKEIFIPVGLLVFAIVTGYTIKLSEAKFIASNKKKLEVLFVYTPIALALIIVMYFLSDTMFDFIYVNLIVIIITWSSFVVDRKIKDNYATALFHYFASYIIMFFLIKEINKHLVIPMPHIWMINLATVNIIFAMKDGNKSDRKGLLSFSANLIGIIIVLITMSYLSEPFAGTSKQEYLVKAYLLEEGYEKDEIVKLRRINSNIKSKEKRVFVHLLKNGSEKYNKYIYENGIIKRKEELK